jgi:hypothetical protein
MSRFPMCRLGEEGSESAASSNGTVEGGNVLSSRRNVSIVLRRMLEQYKKVVIDSAEENEKERMYHAPTRSVRGE